MINTMGFAIMSHAAKIAITIDPLLLQQLDVLVQNRSFKNRSQAVQQAVAGLIEQVNKTRFAEECEKLSAEEEQSLADEFLPKDPTEWPEF